MSEARSAPIGDLPSRWGDMVEASLEESFGNPPGRTQANLISRVRVMAYRPSRVISRVIAISKNWPENRCEISSRILGGARSWPNAGTATIIAVLPRIRPASTFLEGIPLGTDQGCRVPDANAIGSGTPQHDIGIFDGGYEQGWPWLLSLPRASSIRLARRTGYEAWSIVCCVHIWMPNWRMRGEGSGVRSTPNWPANFIRMLTRTTGRDPAS